ncbi:MAG TPA: SPFH domain-containing protein, partial [Polyangiaceae bacterium]|nr:SPFH domain-containing protein [Polyangiaceae bacterium]
EVIESRISHLAYAPEIASAMLQRQQASAIVAARAKIVEGAVGMVETAVDELASRDIVQLDQAHLSALVSNMLVVLCSDSPTQPVVQTGAR